MRYRPFGATGITLSAVGLFIGEDLARRHGPEVVWTALENGINLFEVATGDTVAITALGEALKGVERRLVYVVLRAGTHRSLDGRQTRDFSPPAVVNALRIAGSSMRAGAFDLVLLDDPSSEELSARTLMALRAEQEAGRVRMLGVSGEDDAVDAYISARAFDVLAQPYNLTSGWRERLRLKAAGSQDMPVLGYRFFPPEFDARERAAPQPRGASPTRLNLFRKAEVVAHAAASEGYDFLASVKGWTPQELCLAYSLTEPGLSSMLISPRSLDELEALAAVPDRDFPTFVAAQIEMARFSQAPLARSA